MKCSFCGSESRSLVPGPNEYAICDSCVERGPTIGRVLDGKRCSFCNQVIGRRKRLLRPRRLEAARAAGAGILCTECLRTATIVMSDRLRVGGRSE